MRKPARRGLARCRRSPASPRPIRAFGRGLRRARRLPLTPRMKSDADIADTPQTPGARVLGVLRYSLMGILFDLLVGVLWVFYVMLATAGGGCDGEPCTAAGFYLSRVEFALKIGLALLFYMCVILIPLLAAPPLVGFVID